MRRFLGRAGLDVPLKAPSRTISVYRAKTGLTGLLDIYGNGVDQGLAPLERAVINQQL